MQEQEMGTVLEQAVQAFSKALPDGSFEYWSLWRVYFPHASALLRNITVDNVDTAVIYLRMSPYLRLVGRYNEAEDLARRSTHIRANFLGQEHPDTLTSMVDLASIYGVQGRLKEAEELELQVVKI